MNATIVRENPAILETLSKILAEKEVFIEVSLGGGTYEETVWGCDLTEEYIKVNAYYTT